MAVRASRPAGRRDCTDARMHDLDARIDRLVRVFNEPVVPAASVHRWLAQFAEEDQATALLLLETVEYHSYPRLVRDVRRLHALLRERLRADGFDADGLSDVDFSREFTCKSGDIISYIYRRANLIPTVWFRTFDALVAAAREDQSPRRRALVILDDYIGTGSQFVFQFVARSADDRRVMAEYERVYLCCVVVHDEALRKARLLRAGRFADVLEIEEEQLTCVDFTPDEQALRDALASVDWSRVELVAAERDRSMLCAENGAAVGGAAEGEAAETGAIPVAASLDADRRAELTAFLERYALEGTEGGTSLLLGRHAFFYGAPNSVAPILLPLFRRVEDFTIYPSETFVGITTDIIDYDLDGPQDLQVRRAEEEPPGAARPEPGDDAVPGERPASDE